MQGSRPDSASASLTSLAKSRLHSEDIRNSVTKGSALIYAPCDLFLKGT